MAWLAGREVFLPLYCWLGLNLGERKPYMKISVFVGHNPVGMRMEAFPLVVIVGYLKHLPIADPLKEIIIQVLHCGGIINFVYFNLR